jgi:hypothetical protein
LTVDDCRFSTDEFPIKWEPMTDSQTPRRLGRSILALFAGFVLVVVLSISTDLAMHVTGIFPPPGQPMGNGLLLIATAYRTVFCIAGSYTTAWLAPRRPMLHAMIGGAIGLVLGLAGAVAMWNRPESAGVHWYPIAVALLGLPTAWLGGMIRNLQSSARTTSLPV